ncbi:helix-turn-helix domain-containing protein [Paraburkholderia sediminicola]|uniref:helix-turn-helix domain-containing protein n=1 Tax=Paraburkholderia sediminicola TaxID=458836 RepID=UPI0038B74FFE
MPPEPDDQMLSTEDVAKILNVRRQYVVTLADSGKLSVVTRANDGQRRIPAAAVEACRTEQMTRSRNALDELAVISQAAGLYNSEVTNGRK